jgi:DNA-binding transcriptional MerR regulator
MRIGELARRAGVDVQTVRYYEREGLLEAPARAASGYRTYGAQHLERLSFVRHCRALDMPLAEIRRLIHLSGHPRLSCEKVDELVRSHLERVRAKRVADCKILGDLIHAAQGEACACHPESGT